MKLRFGSVCSGIEAASVAWNPLGWEAAWLSEIEPFPCAVLKHHYPSVINLGDMATLPQRILSGEVEAPDILCGGTPCQAFSFAGQRQSLSDERGNLSLVFCEIADAIDSVRTLRGQQPCVIFWENVPGVLNTKDNAFGYFLARLAHCASPYEIADGKWGGAGVVVNGKRSIAWRTLDAQYFGVPQRRRRIYLVASAREGFCAEQILFERTGVSGNLGTSKAQGERPATFAQGGFGEFVESAVAGTTRATGGDIGGGSETLVYANGEQTCGTVSSKWAKGSGGPSGHNEWTNMVIQK